MHEVFEEDDMRQLFRWLTKFLNNPYTEDDQLVPAGGHACYNSLTKHAQRMVVVLLHETSYHTCT